MQAQLKHLNLNVHSVNLFDTVHPPLMEMIKIKCIDHILFCIKNKTFSSTATIYDFMFFLVQIILLIASFYSKQIYHIFNDYSYIIAFFAIFFYFILMCLNIFEKIPHDKFALYEYFKFSNVDFIILVYLKTFITNVVMSVVVANFLNYWKINFWISYAITFFLGAAITFFIHKLVLRNKKRFTLSDKKRRYPISKLFFTNKYLAFFYKTFFGYPKGSYEFIDIFLSFFFIVCIIYFGIFYYLNSLFVIYIINFFVSIMIIDIYSIEYKNRKLSLILGIEIKKTFRFSLITSTSIGAVINIIYLILFSFVCEFSIINFIIAVFVLSFFFLIQYSLCLIAHKKFQAHLPIMSAFIPNIIVMIIPVFNLIYSLYIIIKMIKEQKHAYRK